MVKDFRINGDNIILPGESSISDTRGQKNHVTHDLKAEFLRLYLHHTGNFSELSTKLNVLIDASFPEIGAEIEQFIGRNREMVDTLRGTNQATKKNWSDLKREAEDPDFPMTKQQMSDHWENFRHEALITISNAVDAMIAECELPELEWICIGTQGYQSDIDLTVRTKNPQEHNETAVSLGKVLFDTLWFATFKGTSGFQIDLETYTCHEGERETILQIHNEKYKQEYASIGLMATHMQIFRSLEPKDWHIYIESLCDSLALHFSEADIDNFKRLLKEVNDFETMTHKVVLKEIVVNRLAKQWEQAGTQPDVARQVAKEAVKHLGSEEIDEQTQEIDILSEEYKLAKFNYKLAKLLHLGLEMNQCDDKKRKIVMELMRDQGIDRSQKQEELDVLEVRIAHLGLLRECFLDEGYISQGAYLDVCKRGGGQADMRAWEAVISQIDSTGIAGYPALGRMSQDNELLESLQENLGMYFHKLHSYSSPSQGAIEASKYSERIVTACDKLVTMHPDKNWGDLPKSIAELRKIAQALLIIKRQNQISEEEFEKFLEDGFFVEQHAHTEIKNFVRHRMENFSQKKETKTFLGIKIPRLIHGQTEQQLLKEFKNALIAAIHQSDYQVEKKERITEFVQHLNVESLDQKDPSQMASILLKELDALFPDLDVDHAIKATLRLAKEIKDDGGDRYLEMSKHKRHQLLFARMAQEHLITVDNHLRPLNNWINASVKSFMSIQDHTDHKLAGIHKKSRKRTIHRLKLNMNESVEAISNEIMKTVIQITSVAIAEGLYPKPSDSPSINLCNTWQQLHGEAA